jgi:hypothetical protein
MSVTSKQIRNTIYVILICCLRMHITNAMERQTSEMEKKTREEASLWTKLPKEIKNHILSFLVSAKNEKEAVKNIKYLGATSKEFYNFINDPSVLGSIIREISNQFKQSPVDVALGLGNPGTLKWLKEYRQQYPQEKEAIAHRLDNGLLKVKKNINKNLAAFFIKAGANVNKVDETRCTLLNWATFWGHKDIVELLLNAGADVNTQDENGETPLMFAVHKGKDMVENLINAGADVNKADNAGQVPLCRAALAGYKDIVELLLNAGADVNTQTENGETPLQWAVYKGHKDIVELLLNAGADVNKQDKYGRTPFYWAVKKAHNMDMGDFLLKHGAHNQ